MNKVLIVYASKTGTARDAAALLAKNVSSSCDLYDCGTGNLTRENAQMPQTNGKPNISEYDTVVVGTAMYMGMPLGQMRRFCNRQKAALLGRKLILFTCGIGSEEWDKKSLFKALPASLTSHASHYCHVGGEIRQGGLNAFERAAMRGYIEQNGAGPGIDLTAIAQLTCAINKVS